MNYFAHNDAKGQDARVRLANYHAARERMLATFKEYDLGAITLFLPANVAQLRAREALILSGKLGV